MAVKIIEEKPDQSVVKQVVCKNCGVKLEYVPMDIENHSAKDYGGGTDTYYYINCPKCQNHVYVKGIN